MLDILRTFGLPQNYSMQGGGIDDVISWTHILMLLLFVGWGAFFIYTLIRFRAARSPRADYVASAITTPPIPK